jgi:uncharacterized protein YbjT (DUF2867 family)
MYVIMGITGQVGSVVGRILLKTAQQFRAAVRDAAKGQAWASRGCEVELANIDDTESLTAAFREAGGVFVSVPPNFDPSPEFSEARATAISLLASLEAAHPERVVYLSKIGVQASQFNMLPMHTIIEKAIGELPMPIALERPACL